jgi:hypothetical protein
MEMRFAAPFPWLFFLCAALGALPSTAAVSPPPRNGSLDALLARARVASGAPYRFHIVSHSRESAGGQTFAVTTESEGEKYRAKRCAADLCSGFYFDGERSFDANFNDTALPLSARVDGLQATLRAIASYAFTAPDFRRTGGTLGEREPVLHNGKKYRQLGVAAPLGAVLDAIIDPDTGLVAGVISDERKLAFEFRDQRAIGRGITLPFSIYLNGTELEHFDDRTVVAGALQAPPGLVPQIDAGTTTVAFAHAGERPIVPCSIGGQNVACLFDTGNSGLTMSSELASKLALQINADGASASTSNVSGMAKAPALSVGAAHYPMAYYVVAHDVHQNGYDVVLGADAFARTRIAVDYGHRTLTVASAGAALPSEIGISFENYVPVLPVRIGDQVVLPLAVDTGDDGSLEVAFDDYAKHRALFDLRNVTSGSESDSGEVALARVGAWGVERARLDATHRQPPAGDGRIGNGVLDHFAVTFDYARSGVALVPRSGDTAVHPAP